MFSKFASQGETTFIVSRKSFRNSAFINNSVKENCASNIESKG